MKKCSKCKVLLEDSCFFKNAIIKSGLNSSCKSCDKHIREAWRNKNRERIKKVTTEYRKNNLDKYVKLNVENNKKLRHRNPAKMAEHNMRGLIHRALMSNYKTGKSVELLGCSVEFYKNYLSSMFSKKMKWSNRGTVWEIDHIVPLSKFDCSNYDEARKAFHYTNTQVLLVSDHKTKTFTTLNSE